MNELGFEKDSECLGVDLGNASLGTEAFRTTVELQVMETLVCGPGIMYDQTTILISPSAGVQFDCECDDCGGSCHHSMRARKNESEKPSWQEALN